MTCQVVDIFGSNCNQPATQTFEVDLTPTWAWGKVKGAHVHATVYVCSDCAKDVQDKRRTGQ